MALLASAASAAAPATRPAGDTKELYIPDRVFKVPNGNDYTNADSEYCYRRSIMSENLAMFWSKEYGDHPNENPDPKKRFDPQQAIAECERFYQFYVDTLKFADRGHSVTDKYKLLIYVFGGNEGTAFGGGDDNKIGILWTPAVRINQKPYGALAHEMGHSFQSIVRFDGAPGFKGGPIYEMTSQFMLWQAYPEWQTFENYHLVAFMKQTHLSFLHPENQYHSPYLLEYWAYKHGQDFVAKLWRSAKENEDPVQAYQRMAGIDQKQFNDEVFDAARRFVTWDMPRIEKTSARYANQHTSELRQVTDGWYEIAPGRCPQNYGYNAIKLDVPAAGTDVKLNFKGEVGAEGFHAVKPELAGWRYGFLAVKSDGSRVYGPVNSDATGTAEFKVPADTSFLWFVVSGTPTEHWTRNPRSKPANDEQWPYRFQLTGTKPNASVIR
ncbi:MAG: DUF6055 domain-containing protein [Tepidisphaeraceae bacterium]